MMETLAGQGAIASRSRVVATTFICALSVTVRFTTATGNERKIEAQSAHRSTPMTFNTTRNGAPILCRYREPKSAWPIVFQNPKFFRVPCARPTAIPTRPHTSASQ